MTSSLDHQGAVQPRAILREVWLHVVLTLAMTLPMLILYAIGALGPFLVRDLGIRPGLLGYATMSAFGFAALLSLWAGPVVDRLGARRALGALFYAVALAYVLIITLPGFAGVVSAVAICGVAQALANPVTNLLIAQTIAPAKKPFAVGLKQSGVQLGALVAGLILPSVASQFGWRVAVGMFISVALFLAAEAPAVAPLRPPQRGERQPYKLPRPNKMLLLLMSVQFCAGAALSGFVTFLPSFATTQGSSAPEAGAMVALFGAMGMASRVLLTPLGARLRDESLLLGILLAAAAIALFVTKQADVQSHWKLWFGAAAMGVTAVATNAIAMAMLLRDSSFGSATGASGLLSAAFFGGFALGAPAYGAFYSSAFGVAGAWSALIAIALAGSALASLLALLRSRRATH